ncbi:MAG: HAD-IA family hydrolase [Pseudolysinimonas sp.]
MHHEKARVVFWDFDGTLARRDGLWSATLESAARIVAPELGVTAADLRPELTVGFPWHTPDLVVPPRSADEWWNAQRPLFLRAYARAGVRTKTAELAVAEIPREYYRPAAWALAHDAIPALKITATAGYRNAILSNHAPELPTLVEQLGLGPFIDGTITSAAVGAEKPNPRIFAYALELMNAGTDVWMIGDNPIADIAGAEAAGIQAILVTENTTILQAATHISEAAR